MKNIILATSVIVCLLLVTTSSLSQDRGFGIGVIVGEPTGISMKGWLSSTSALDVGLAWSFAKETSFHIHGDYLLHSFNVFKTQERIPLYYGIGGRIKTGRREDDRVGLRMVVGIGYIFRDAPVDLFVEVAPILDLAPSTDFRMNAGLGARFFFH
ncbi:MAG: hypothetical protein HY707_14215 [Ignavibacteriae bacterium]|nr:hypothetical protein [Ignavibacteriota bacterium]